MIAYVESPSERGSTDVEQLKFLIVSLPYALPSFKERAVAAAYPIEEAGGHPTLVRSVQQAFYYRSESTSMVILNQRFSDH